jgi:hypothetical protein
MTMTRTRRGPWPACKCSPRRPLPTGTKIAALAGLARHHHGGPLRAVVGATRDGLPRSAPRGSCPAAASAALSAQDGANPAGAYDTPVVHTSAALEFRHTYYEIALRKRDELRAAQARRRKRLAAAAMGTGDGDDDGDDGDDDGDDDDDDVIVGDGGGGGGVVASAVTAEEAGGLSGPTDAVLSASASGYVDTLAFEQPLHASAHHGAPLSPQVRGHPRLRAAAADAAVVVTGVPRALVRAHGARPRVPSQPEL